MSLMLHLIQARPKPHNASWALPTDASAEREIIYSYIYAAVGAVWADQEA